MAETTYLELVTPAKIMAQKNVQMVVAPGVEGLFGVLPRHAPMLADLARGVVEVHEDGKVTERYMIDGGFADVSRRKRDHSGRAGGQSWGCRCCQDS